MTDAPPEAGVLFSRHTSSAFLERGYWKGIWESERSARSGFEKELVGNATVFIFMASSLTNTLRSIEISISTCRSLKGPTHRFRDRRLSQRGWLEVENTFVYL